MSDGAQHSILVVEDEPLLSMDIERLLGEAAFRVIGPAANMAQALRYLDDDPPDLTVLDLNLAGEMVFPLLDVLAKRGIPFLILSGHSQGIVPERYRHHPFLQKPYQTAHLLGMIRRILWSERGLQLRA